MLVPFAAGALVPNENPQELAQFFINFRFGRHCAAHFGPEHFSITGAQARNMTSNGRLRYRHSRSQVGIGGQWIGAGSDEGLKTLEQLLFPFGFVGRGEPV